MHILITPRKRKIIIWSAAAILVLAGAGIAYWQYTKEAPKQEVKKQEKTEPAPAPQPTVVAATLDGTMVSPELANRHPLAIMIENSPEARPQIGLTDASIIYETLAEGGITRFMAIYGPRIPAKAGPVRSARTYFVDWTKEYDAFYAHVGGSADALNKIKAQGVKDMDQFAIGKRAFWRDNRGMKVATEHTMFTDPAKLYDIAWERGWSKEADFTKFNFKDDILAAQRPAGGTLSINFSGSTAFAVKFAYDPASNTYLRTMAGVPHKDGVSGAQIAPKNVIVQIATEIAKAGKKDHDVQTVGSGIAKIYLDGKEIIGTWKKEAGFARTTFYDAAGAPITYNRGQTWIAVVRPNAPVTWTP